MDVETTEEGVMGKIIVSGPRLSPFRLGRRSHPRTHLLTPGLISQLQDGAKEIQVGTLIAIIAEEGDDISNLSASDYEDSSASASSSSPAPAAEAPKKDTPAAPASTPAPTSSSSSSSSSHSTSFSHSQPLSPSVNRLLLSSSLSSDEVSALKGSGMRGALTKGDVLKAMGKTTTVWGSKEAEGLEKEGQKGVSARYKVSPESPAGIPTLRM